MRTLPLAFVVSVLVVGVTAVAHGREAGQPLVVAVDVAPGGGVDAAQVRSVIGRELGRPIVAFVDGAAGEAPAADEPDLLLVGVNRDRLALSLRRRSEPIVERSVQAPVEPTARLRAIAWLAGNVARDQISPFLRASADLGKDPRVDAAAASSEVAPPVTAPTPAATEPPPIAPPPLPAVGAVETLAREAPRAPQRPEAEWSVTVSGGPALYDDMQTATYERSLAFQVELVKHRPDRWLWGVGADLGPFGAVDAGLAVLGGGEWRWGKTRLEANAGLGIEGVRVHHVQTTMPSPTVSETTDTVSSEYGPYLRAFMTLSRELTPSWDLVLRVGVNSVGRLPAVTSGLGLRLNLM